MIYDTYKVDVPEGRSGDWSVRRFTVSDKDAEMERFRAVFSGGRGVPTGTYTGLYRHNSVIMSDTPDEIRDHVGFIGRAEGRVLIAGLGIGMVLQAVARKPEVRAVTVVEKSGDVIALMLEHIKSKDWASKVELAHHDILDWKPPKGAVYDCGWFDIWDNICIDNLKDIAVLNRRFARKVSNRGHWKEGLLRLKKRQESRMGW